MQAAHVTGGDALHGAILIEQHFGAGEARVDLDTQRFGLFAQPAADVAERDDVVAFVMEAAGQQAVRHLGGACFAEDEETVFGNRGVERAPSSFQLGSSSFRARGSMTAPDRMWAPISAPFSIRQTEMSAPFRLPAA
jgi:hypothetical protein